MSGDREVTDNAYVWVPGTDDDLTSATASRSSSIADKASYAPGDTAKVAVRGASPTTPVLVTKEARTLTWYDVRQPAANGVFDVPVTDADIGDTWVNLLYLKDDKVYYAEQQAARAGHRPRT